MKISIITCTWNSEKFLAQTIASIEQQTHADVECVFVDGGSTDGTFDLIAQCTRPKTVLKDVSGGIGRAMNAGIRAATGNVIAHLHSDDYYLHGGVLALVNERLQQSQARWLFGRIKSDIDGALFDENYTVPPYSYPTLLKRNIVPHPATFVRREIFDEFGLFDESFRLAMDYDMWLRIGRQHMPLQLSEQLTAFRRHDGSATQANQLRSLNEDFRARFRHAPWHRYAEFALRYVVRRSRLQRA